MKLKWWGWGIVDKDGKPMWAESCVCRDREPLDEMASELNYDDLARRPYRVVRLYFKQMGREK